MAKAISRVATKRSDKMVEGMDIPCCPELESKACEESLTFKYKLPFNSRIHDNQIPVDVMLVFEFHRCSEGMARGDLQHTMSLLPGESVRLFTADKSSRWSYDKETGLSYRHERTSSESHLTFGFARAVTDINVAENTSSDSRFEESWAEGGGGASVDLFGIVEIGGGGGGGGYSASSSYDFARNISQHAESSASHVAASVRASRSVSMGEVETRTHAEGESEQHFEAGTRRISNENQCHAVNYFVWQLMKKQTISWRLAAIKIDVNDAAAPTSVTGVVRTPPKVAVMPQAILATDIQQVQLAKAQFSPVNLAQANYTVMNTMLKAPRVHSVNAIDNDLRFAAAAAVKSELEKAGMMDDDGKPTKRIIAELSWQKETLIPTGGLVVKGCIDPCNVCEQARQEEIALELEHMALQNELLKKQIELLDKHKDYRCCPAGEEEMTDNDS